MSKPETAPILIDSNHYFEQLRHAQRMMQEMVDKMLADGYVYDPSLGCYVSKDGNTTVHADG